MKRSRVLTSKEVDAIGRRMKSRVNSFSKSTLGRGREAAGKVKV